MLAATDSWLWPQTDDRRLWNARFQCGSPRTAAACLLAFRWVSFSFLFAVQTWDWWWSQEGGYQLAYLTNDSLWLNILYFLCVSIISTIALARSVAEPYVVGMPPLGRGSSHGGCSRCHELAWLHAKRLTLVLKGIAVSWEPLVVLLFWLLLFGGIPTDADVPLWLLDNVVMHGVAAAFPLLDAMLSAQLLWDSLCVPVLFWAVVYLFMNWGVSDTVQVVYSVLAWNSGANALLVLGALAGVTIIYFAVAAVVGALDRWVRGASAQQVRGLLPKRSGASPESSSTAPWFCGVGDMDDSPVVRRATCRNSCAATAVPHTTPETAVVVTVGLSGGSGSAKYGTSSPTAASVAASSAIQL